MQKAEHVVKGVAYCPHDLSADWSMPAASSMIK